MEKTMNFTGIKEHADGRKYYYVNGEQITEAEARKLRYKWRKL